jgi:predicted metal-dependent peptidase
VTAEVSGLLDEKARVTLIDTSSEAATARRVTSRQQLAQVQRGEGTDMGAGLEAAGRARPRPHLVVVLTDGDTDWPERKPVHGAGVVVVLFGSRAQQLAAQVPHWASTLVVDKLV